LVSFSSFSQEKKLETVSDVTTYYFIRHAEKDRSNPSEKNPHLMEAGLKRADNWNTVLVNVKFDAVYSTDYHRTLETAKPIAEKNNLNVLVYGKTDMDNVSSFLNDNVGKTVLVVGHSNTTPAFVNSILKQEKYDDIDDNNNGNLYILTIIGDKIADQVLTIN
jgi:broad specificity phosphatase PhoE